MAAEPRDAARRLVCTFDLEEPCGCPPDGPCEAAEASNSLLQAVARPEPGTGSASAALLDDLTAEELVALGHGLRMVPDNVMVGSEFLWQSDAWKSMWEKIAHAVNTRVDVAPYRKTEGST